MKKILVMLLLFATYLGAGAKDYVPIHLNDTAFFVGKDNRILAVRIDSIKVINNQNYNFLNKTWNEENPSCVRPNGYSWLGPYFIEESDSVYIFFNKNNDTIRIEPRAPLNTSFRLLKFPNGDYIRATVSSIANEQFLGLSDTVKYFFIEHCDAEGEILCDLINGTEFSISKNYGFVNIFDFINFPETFVFTNYTLSGKTNPQAGKTFLTPNEIFNFDVGDEFHYNEYYSGYQLNWTEERIRKVLDKYYSVNGDTTKYKIEITSSYSGTRWDSAGSHNVERKSVDTSFENHVIIRKNYIPHEPILNDSNIDYNLYVDGYEYLIEPEINNRRILTDCIDPLIHLVDSCWQIVMDLWGPGQYLEGCGFFHSRDAMHGDVFEHSNSLVYYKKGNEVWGNPIIISVEEQIDKNQIQVFPNPCLRNVSLSIRNSVPIIRINILDALGRKRLEKNVELLDDYQLKTGNLEPGIYFIIISDANNKAYPEKLIIE